MNRTGSTRKRVLLHGGRAKSRVGGRSSLTRVPRRVMRGVRQCSPGAMDPFKQDTGSRVKNIGELKDLRGRQPGKRMVVWIYADWCGHCQHFLPEWKAMVRSTKDIKFVTIDASDAHAVQGTMNLGYPSITGFPTIWLFGEDQEMPVVYRGSRTPDAIKKAVYKLK